MQEGRVSVAGQYHALPTPFHVLATQNPLEHEGTYTLPEAQLDRFLLQVDVGYPDRDTERQMMVATTGSEEATPVQVMTAEELRAAQTLVRRLPVGESVVEAILAIVRAGRPESSDLDEVVENVGWGRARGPSGANAHVSRAGVNRRPSLAVLGRCRRACEACVAASYGAKFAARHSGVTVDSIIDLLCQRIA